MKAEIGEQTYDLVLREGAFTPEEIRARRQDAHARGVRSRLTHDKKHKRFKLRLVGPSAEVTAATLLFSASD